MQDIGPISPKKQKVDIGQQPKLLAIHIASNLSHMIDYWGLKYEHNLSHTPNSKSIHPLAADIFVIEIFSIIPYAIEKNGTKSPKKQEVDIGQQCRLFTTYALSIKRILNQSIH